MKKLTKIAATVLGVVATMGVAGVANADPLLTIVQGATGPMAQEVIGDAGGSVYPWAGAAGVGAGAPSTTTTPNPWPTGPGFAADPSFAGSGMSGYDTSYLWLSKSADVTFQFMGGGNSSYSNRFFVNGVQLFQDIPGAAVTNPCAVALGATTPSCIAGVNQFTIPITVAAGGGYVPFWFVTGADSPVTVTNNGLGNLNDASGLPGYMLGVDPYQAAAPYQLFGTTVYAALSDRSRAHEFDHDYSDMGVRISVVPEPGTVALLGLGLLAMAGLRRRRS